MSTFTARSAAACAAFFFSPKCAAPRSRRLSITDSRSSPTPSSHRSPRSCRSCWQNRGRDRSTELAILRPDDPALYAQRCPPRDFPVHTLRARRRRAVEEEEKHAPETGGDAQGKAETETGAGTGRRRRHARGAALIARQQ